MIRFGMVGCGLHGERYLRHIANDLPDQARVVALWRRDRRERERLASRYGAEPCAGFEELLDRRDLDAFLVTTPPGNHATELSRLIPTGRAILIEKPLTATLEQCDALWREHPRLPQMPLMVGQTLRYNPALRRAREEMGRLGRIHRIRIQQRLEPTTIAWQRDDAQSGGGSVTLTGVHLFDLLRWLVGRTPDAVSGRWLAVEGYPTSNVFDACFEYEEEGILCATEVSKFSRTRSCVLEIVGTEAQLVVDYLHGTLDRMVGRETERVAATGNPPTLVGTVKDFCRTLERGESMPIGFHDGRETLRMAAAIRVSNEMGRRVRLEELAPADGPAPA